MTISAHSLGTETLPITDDMMLMTNRVFCKIQFEEKVKLEREYGVHIEERAVWLACIIARRCSNFEWPYINSSPSSSSSNPPTPPPPSSSSLRTPSHRSALLSNGGGVDNNPEVILRKKALELLEKACERLRHELVTNVNLVETYLDRAEYMLNICRVELNEIKKEKDHASQIYIRRLEMENEDLEAMWDRYLKQWKQLQETARQRFEEICLLKQVQMELLQRLELESLQEKVPSFEVFQRFRDTLTKLFRTTAENFKFDLTVRARLIAEVTSLVTGVPVSWILNYFKPPLLTLKNSLSQQLFEHNYVINKISSALLSPWSDGSGHRPIGSFLFLGPHHGRSKVLVSALAHHMFGSKDVVIRFDMSEYRDLHSVGCDSCILGIRVSGYNHEEHGVGRKLIEAVKNRPFCVLMFENVDKANSYAIDILIDILRHGSLIDRQGTKVDFTKSLVIMTSDVGKDSFQHWLCNCLEKVPSRPMKDGLYFRPTQKVEHACGFLPILGEAKKRFKSELLELLDDVIVFNGLSLPQLNAIARMHISEGAFRIGKYGLIVYPSDAALRSIIIKSSCATVGIEGLEIWLEKNMDHVLSEMVSENKINAMLTVYIDALMGTDELSYREEYSRDPMGDDISSRFKESLKELRRAYLKEKECVNNIYSLWRAYFELITTLDSENIADPDDILLVVRRLGYMMDDLINTAKTNLMHGDYKLAPVNSLNEEAESSQRVRLCERASRLEGLQTILNGNLDGKYQGIDVVAEALRRSIDAAHSLPHHLVKSFLFLGLTHVGKVDLVKGLAELFGADDRAQIVTQINIQEYSDPDSFFQLMDGSFDLPSHGNHEQHGLGLPEAVEMRPYRILVVDQVEKAQHSVFSTLLSVLDHGTWRYSDGRIIDLCHTIVIITSDLGNKRILANLVRHASQDAVEEGGVEQCNFVGHASQDTVEGAGVEQEGESFRFELLNRIDEIVIFNPFAQEQLRKNFRLSLRAGSHLEEGLFQSALSDLFSKSDDSFVERLSMEFALLQLSPDSRSGFSEVSGSSDYVQMSSSIPMQYTPLVDFQKCL